jgi:hypothetical protein
MLVYDGLQLMKTGTQAIDIERDDLHVRDAHVVFISRYWTRNPVWMQVPGLCSARLLYPV